MAQVSAEVRKQTMTSELKFAIEDAKRFIGRVEPFVAVAEAGLLTDADLKLIKRLSPDVTRAMKALREAADAVPVAEQAVNS